MFCKVVFTGGFLKHCRFSGGPLPSIFCISCPHSGMSRFSCVPLVFVCIYKIATIFYLVDCRVYTGLHRA